MALCIKLNGAVLAEGADSEMASLLTGDMAQAGAELLDMATGRVLATSDGRGWQLTQAGLTFNGQEKTIA